MHYRMGLAFTAFLGENLQMRLEISGRALFERRIMGTDCGLCLLASLAIRIAAARDDRGFF